MNFKNIFLLASIGISFSLAASDRQSHLDDDWKQPLIQPPAHHNSRGSNYGPHPAAATAPAPSASAGHQKRDYRKESFETMLKSTFHDRPDLSLVAMYLGAKVQQTCVQTSGTAVMTLACIQSATEGTKFNTEPLDRYYAAINAQQRFSSSSSSSFTGHAVPKNISHEISLGLEANLQRQQRISNIKWCLGGMAVAAGVIKLWSLSSGSKTQTKK